MTTTHHRPTVPATGTRPMPVLVLDVVGLTPRALEDMPHLRGLAERGSRATLGTVLPAVTCSVQSTFLTGTLPAEHGVVGNGWFFRDLGEVMFWRQPNSLVGGEKLWDALRRSHPGAKVANVCWWYAMGMDVDTVVTPRPVYHADGRKSPDCYTRPTWLHDELTAALGEFPLFQYWGPTAAIASSRWIVEATRRVLPHHDLTLAYVPHLDYDLQRFGPRSPAGPRGGSRARCRAGAAARRRRAARGRGGRAQRVRHHRGRPPRAHQPGAAAGGPARGAHPGRHGVPRPVDVAPPSPWPTTRWPTCTSGTSTGSTRCAPCWRPPPAWSRCSTARPRRRTASTTTAAATSSSSPSPRAWFTYYYWLDDARAPDFARGVEIHRKPGYDPAELFFDPADRTAKARAGLSLVRKKLGLRYAMKVVPLDARWVKGSHGRLPEDPADATVLITSTPGRLRESVAATEVRDLVLQASGVVAAVNP